MIVGTWCRIQKRFISYTSSQILPTVRNDFLFHFLSRAKEKTSRSGRFQPWLRDSCNSLRHKQLSGETLIAMPRSFPSPFPSIKRSFIQMWKREKWAVRPKVWLVHAAVNLSFSFRTPSISWLAVRIETRLIGSQERIMREVLSGGHYYYLLSKKGKGKVNRCMD